MSCGGGTYKGNSTCSKCLLAQKPGREAGSLSTVALRARRHRQHKAGDHSLCDHPVCSCCGKRLSWSKLPPDLRRCRDCRARYGNGQAACTCCGAPMQLAKTTAPRDRRICRPCRMQEPQRVPEPRVCDLCKESYVPKPSHRPGQRFCSKSCAQAWRNGARPPYSREVIEGMARKVRQSRIRHQRHAETWDGVTDAEILERDRWRCGICRKAIGRKFKWPHPRSASIDHIIPLSEGGDDTAGNKRAAHLACNCGRMNRGGGEQPMLFGQLLR